MEPVLDYARHPRPPGRNGRWLVVGLLGVGVVMALVALKYRLPRPPPGTNPSTRGVGE